MRRGAVVFLSCVCVFMIIVPGDLNAKAMFVRDWIVINIRASADDGSATIAYANTGDRLEQLEETAGWSKVRTGDGREGWVGSRFLTDRPPQGLHIQQLEARIKALQEENAGLRKGEPQGRSEEETPPGGVAVPVDAPGGECAELRAAHEKLLAENQACTRDKDILATEVSRLKTSERLFFTFIGGVFIILGVLVGLFIQMAGGRSKKQGYRF